MSDPSLDELIQQHFERIHRAALVLTGNTWDADDLAQETFLVFSRDRDRFQGRSNTYTWLYGILLNLERHYRRRHGIWRRKFQELCERMAGRDRSNPPAEAPLEAAEWKKGLWAHVSQLPAAQRQTLVLRFSEGLQYEEIAQAMDCPLGTVKSRLHHGLEALRERLGDRAVLTEIPDHTYEDLVHVF